MEENHSVDHSDESRLPIMNILIMAIPTIFNFDKTQYHDSILSGHQYYLELMQSENENRIIDAVMVTTRTFEFEHGGDENDDTMHRTNLSTMTLVHLIFFFFHQLTSFFLVSSSFLKQFIYMYTQNFLYDFSPNTLQKFYSENSI
jgi:hypothetical protein